MIELHDLSKAYRTADVETTALNHINLEIAAGEFIAIMGPSGCGKSTLLRIIAGIEPADAGTVEVAGAIGYVPQAGGLDPYLKPVDHFALFGAAAGRGRRDAVSEGNRLANELGWDATAAPVVGQLSGGTEQKLSVIAALLGDPDVLLLDEPYQGMDAESARRFWELLWAWQENGGSSLVSSHSPDALRKASTVVEIEGLPAR